MPKISPITFFLKFFAVLVLLIGIIGGCLFSATLTDSLNISFVILLAVLSIISSIFISLVLFGMAQIIDLLTQQQADQEKMIQLLQEKTSETMETTIEETLPEF